MLGATVAGHGWVIGPLRWTPTGRAVAMRMSSPNSIAEAIGDAAVRPTVSVVIPAINEERNLPYLAARMPHDVDEIIFVDGHSTDRTAALARRLWPHAVHIAQTRRGKGNALACGFAAAKGDVLVMVDADGSADPAEIPRFVRALVDGADYAKGSRFRPGGGSDDITKFRWLGNKVLNMLVNSLFATNFTDLCYGFNAFHRHCLDVMRLPDISAEEAQWGDGFEVESLINMQIGGCGLKVVEVFSHEARRIHGASNLRAVRDGFRVLVSIRREFAATRFGPRRFRALVGERSNAIADDRRLVARKRKVA